MCPGWKVNTDIQSFNWEIWNDNAWKNLLINIYQELVQHLRSWNQQTFAILCLKNDFNDLFCIKNSLQYMLFLNSLSQLYWPYRTWWNRTAPKNTLNLSHFFPSFVFFKLLQCWKNDINHTENFFFPFWIMVWTLNSRLANIISNPSSSLFKGPRFSQWAVSCLDRWTAFSLIW